MQLESHATPTVESPQQRYASLHRAIERGLASDEIYKELADVSLRLGHGDEAVRCLQGIRNEAMHQALQSRLVRLKLIEVEPPRTSASHPAAPAASHAGRKALASEDGHRSGLRDHIVDAAQYMFHQHMPWLVLTTTLAFPLVIGVGGFLTAGGSLLLLAAIAALPGLCVMAVVGAMGRQILIASSEGSSDVPAMPDLPALAADARRFLQDAGLVLGTLIVPSVLALALGAPIATGLPCLLVGGFFAPLAWALRQVRGDLNALSPVTVLRAFARCGTGYLGIVGFAWLLFAPAALVTWAVFGRPIWAQLAIVGPLCVLPIFLLSRLLGTWLDTKRAELGAVLTPSPVEPQARTKQEKSDGKAPVAAASKPAVASRLPRRPERLEHFTAPATPVRETWTQARSSPPVAKPPAKPAAAPTRALPPAAKPPQQAPTPARPAPPTERPRQAPPATRTPAKAAPRAIAGLMPNRSATQNGMPDLTRMPGAVVVSGKERMRLGAASRKK